MAKVGTIDNTFVIIFLVSSVCGQKKAQNGYPSFFYKFLKEKSSVDTSKIVRSEQIKYMGSKARYRLQR